MKRDYPNLCKPLKVGNLTFRNRMVSAPMGATDITAEGTPGLRTQGFYEARAKGGAAAVTVSELVVHPETDGSQMLHLSLATPGQLGAFAYVADAIKRHGAIASIELSHSGQYAGTYMVDKKKKADLCQWGPSDGVRPDGLPVRALSVEQIEDIAAAYANAAVLARRAGFQMCMVHAGHGWLINQFLSPYFNRRTDEYGGSFENRMRFPLRLVKAVREAVGDNMAIDFRISQNEYVEGGTTLEDVITFLKAAQEYIDDANLSGGWIFDPVYVKYMMPGYPQELCLNIPRTAIVREQLDIPVTCVGNIPDVKTAEHILAEGKADIVAFARNILADMDLVNKAYRGEEDTIRPCLRCIECASRPAVGGGVRCSVNPQLGRELYYREVPEARVKKKVVVIGGGPAGMMAAQTAVKRGHDVVLFERDKELGGRLKEASVLFCKEPYHKRYLAWDRRETLGCGADIRLGVEATPDLVMAENPDEVIVAIGGEHICPPIPGANGDNVITVTEADLGLAPIGKRVVIVGGGFSALECGIQLAYEGHAVTAIDVQPEDKLWREVMNELRSGLIELRDRYGVQLVDEAMVKEIREGSVVYTRGGEDFEIPADTVVMACGLRPNKELVGQFVEMMPQVTVVGDARQTGNIFSANMSAFDAAVEL